MRVVRIISKRNASRFLVLLSVLVGILLVFSYINAVSKVYAEGAENNTSISSAALIKTFLQDQFCKENFGSTELPYKNLVLVDLNKYYIGSDIGDSATKELQEFLYELLYTNKIGGIPFNAVIYNGNIFYTTCNKWDFTLGLYLDYSKYGKMVVGLLGDVQKNVNAVNTLIQKYKFDTLYLAALGWKNFNDKLVLSARSITLCSKTCIVSGVNILNNISLAKNSIAERPVSVSISDIKFSKNLESLEKGTVALKVTNNLDVTIVNEGYERLYIKELSSSQIPDLYVKSWESLHIPVVINKKSIGPKESVNVIFEIGPYVYPKTYKGKFAIFYGDKKIPGTEFSIATKVTLGDKQLGYIIGRELDYVNVRAKPDLRANVVFKLDVGEYVIVNKVDGAWVNITSQYGDTGWVYRPLIRLQ